MTATPILNALALPHEARVGQRVPKKLLLEHGAPTAADRRRVQEGIEEIRWEAVLKPATVGVPVYRDEVREYLEIAVLVVTLRSAAKAGRLVELVHRAIPYPVVLIAVDGDEAALSLAHKRHSQAGSEAVVADPPTSTASFRPAAPTPVEADFLSSLALAAQPAAHLHATYQGWLDRVTALAAARVTGRFITPGSAELAATRRQALDEHARLEREIAVLRTRAAREKQLARRVELNLELRRLDARRAQLIDSL